MSSSLRDSAGKFKSGNKGFWLGKKRPEVKQWLNSPEANKKKSDFMRGRKMPEEVKEKISKTKTGVSIWGGIGGRAGKMPWMSGERHPMWRRGITKKYESFKNSVQWRLWRGSVFERDNYTCKSCGSKSGYDGNIRLEPHHMIAVNDLIENNMTHHIFNVRNGITLCRPCHQLTIRHK